ncbi:peptide-methionine (S)-S-oxide reductase MsrA [Candidatus Peregrinibacteria bacterium]|nr:MAG: peptide-methionine (S)-S-oxide reductase MsrA [Candidatus Peregrinibacteria bacterium]
MLSACSAPSDPIQTPDPSLNTEATGATLKKATFAGGCFWCMEPSFEALAGTVDVVVGYAGGSEADASYRKVSTGQTDHREAVEITYDPKVVSYETLLDTFWRQINPTDAGGQFADRGHQYTTAIYYRNDEEKNAAEASIAALNASKKFDKPVATVLVPYSTFFLAEDYHQDFYKKSSEHYEAYKKGSGRADFISENWAKEEALKYSR